MSSSLKILVIEDSQDDAELLIDDLKGGDFDPTYERVETAETLSKALDRASWDIIVVDYTLPKLKAPEALALVRGRGLDIPFIIVSGTIGETTAVDMMKAGANDYIMKGNLSRLVPAVKRELREAEERKKRRLAEEALKLKAEQLEKSNEELTRFAFAASHDMKEPLRQILLYSQVLKESYGDKFSNEGNESVNAIVDGASRMLELVDGLITYSSIDPHNINYESIDANKIVGEAVQNLQVLIAESGASIVCGTLPTLMGRPAHILQLFQNLLSNSLKYRRKDQKLEIKIHAKKLNGDWLFSFADNGSGFEQAYADQIFHVFQRLHGSDFPGSGIGLATCKKVVELHGGRIWAESQPDKGASFYFSLPSGATES